MTNQEINELCSAIYATIKTLLPQDIALSLVCDKEPLPEKTAVLGFSIWNQEKGGLWDRHYCSYHFSYDPRHENCKKTWHVRLMYFRRRKQTGNGQFDAQMDSVMRPLNGQNGFEFEITDQLLNLRKVYDRSDREFLVHTLPPDLAWLIQSTYPKIMRSALSASRI